MRVGERLVGWIFVCYFVVFCFRCRLYIWYFVSNVSRFGLCFLVLRNIMLMCCCR